ncbi:phosphoribosylaminoimidazolesuccinocarboxamide synthase, partial [Bacillus sp. S1-R1J2-FB]|uniref:phosphoribosylaminoimidazolesuccinocarboxamide synthase n=1 Tax=Bacillus sp. S1-R1J2-FB TaxID=1973494 RepID=UPI00271510BE
MQTLESLYEGKAKRIYRTESADMVLVEYKDSATAFNGEKKETITGKGRLNNEITTLLFRKLHEVGLKTIFVEKLSETEKLVQKERIILLDVVTSIVIAGSLNKRLG